jgi:ech hydrogenase subunit C
MSLVTWARTRSPWLIHFNAGACNACDIEVVAAITPKYDLERFGALLKGTPRHADVLVVSGSVPRKTAARLKRIYEQMPEPKFVVAVGYCYNVMEGVDKIIPVNAYIPGCPPKPEAILDGVVKLLVSAGY